MKFDLTAIFNTLLGVLTPLLPFIGAGAQGATERALTLPEAQIRKLMGNASEEDKAEAVRLGRIWADAGSDFAVFVASKGKIDPD